MSMQCKICSHINRLDIDREIVRSGNLSKIAKEFGVPCTSLYAHAQTHVTRQLATAWEKKEMEESFGLLNRIDSIISRTEKIFKRNYDAKKDMLALKALDSQRNTIELLAKTSYALHQAKLAEVELIREQSGESQSQTEEEYQEQLKILTLPELKMLEMLSLKITNQSSDIIIAEKTGNAVVSSSDNINNQPRMKRGAKTSKMVAESILDDEVNSDLIVREIKPSEIPSS